jgi:hypothetical protein
MNSSVSDASPNPTRNPSFLTKLSTSYKKNWKPLIAAKIEWDEEYNFTSGPRRGAQYTKNALEETRLSGA